MKIQTVLFAVFLSITACQKPAENFRKNNGFHPGFQSGAVTEPALAELSGIAASRRNPGFFWANTDGGNPDELYLIDSTGSLKAVFTLKNCKNHDWEDLAVGPGPVPGKSYIYLADIGDNDALRTEAQVLRMAEPAIADGSFTVKNIDTIALTYPGGEAFNAESLMIDPATMDLFLATKGGSAKIFAARQPLKTGPGMANLLQFVAKIDLKDASAGDISTDGTEIALRNGQQVIYWKIQPGSSPSAAFANQTPEILPSLDEPQGEALCWSLDGLFYLTTGEQKSGGPQPIHVFKRK